MSKDDPWSVSGTNQRVKQDVSDKKKLAITFAVALFFFAVELMGGLLADSLALTTNSFHALAGKLFVS